MRRPLHRRASLAAALAVSLVGLGGLPSNSARAADDPAGLNAYAKRLAAMDIYDLDTEYFNVTSHQFFSCLSGGVNWSIEKAINRIGFALNAVTSKKNPRAEFASAERLTEKGLDDCHADHEKVAIAYREFFLPARVAQRKHKELYRPEVSDRTDRDRTLVHSDEAPDRRSAPPAR